jgi:hypothetical protein
MRISFHLNICAKPVSLSSTRAAWRPILTGAERRRALAVVKEIAASLPNANWHESPDASLASGYAGLAITYAYLSQAGLSSNQEAAGYLERAAQLISTETVGPSLHEGFTGVGWAAAHLQNQLSNSEPAEIPRILDSALYTHLNRDSWDCEYDLIEGLVGFGVYALERLPDPTATKCLELIVEHLEEIAVCQSNGITFPTKPGLLPGSQREQHQDSYYDVGLAHGVAGVIAFLGGVCASGVAHEKARALVCGTVKWLLSQKMSNSLRGRFPYFVGPNIRRKRARLAWCYGDAGIASALLLAGHCLKEPTWEREALEIARCAADRRPEQTAVVDATLCHGAAGLGHIFNRIFQLTGEVWSRKAALFWLNRTLELKLTGKGVGGFLTYAHDENGKPQWIEDAGFLEGAAGIALALLAATTSVEPSWDRALLLSLPSNATPK